MGLPALRAPQEARVSTLPRAGSRGKKAGLVVARQLVWLAILLTVTPCMVLGEGVRGSIDLVQSSRFGLIEIAGWAYDAERREPFSAVEVRLAEGGALVGRTEVKLPRPDVASVMGSPVEVGWRLAVRASDIPVANGTYAFDVFGVAREDGALLLVRHGADAVPLVVRRGVFEFSPVSSLVYALAILFGVWLALVAPPMVAQIALGRATHVSWCRYLERLAPLTWPLYAVLYLLCVALLFVIVPRWFGHRPQEALTLVFGVLPACVAAALLAMRSVRRDFFRSPSTRAALSAWMAMLGLGMVACCVLFFDGGVTGTARTEADRIARYKTLGAFAAHDNFLPFANAWALARNESFESAERRFGYSEKFADRDALPACLASVVLLGSKQLGSAPKSRFVPYLCFGILCNLLVVPALLGTLRRVAPGRAVWAGLALCAVHPFFFVNVVYTWFKFAGAAFFVTGVGFLAGRRRLSKVLAGVSFGIAANLHAGNLLALPVLFLYYVGRPLLTGRPAFRPEGARDRRGEACRAAALDTAICSFAVLACLLPWSLVKKTYFIERYLLLRSHFFAGAGGDTPEGILAIASAFLSGHSLSEQWAHRWAALLRVPRFEVWGDLFYGLLSSPIEIAAAAWGRAHFAYFGVLAMPWLAAMVCSPRLFLPRAARVRELVLLPLVTSVIVVFMAYSHFTPDFTYHLPIGCCLLLVACAGSAIAWRGSFPARALVVGFAVLNLVFMGAFLASGRPADMVAVE